MKDKPVSSGNDHTPICQLKELIAFLEDPDKFPYPRKCFRFPGPLTLNHVFFINIYQHVHYVPSQTLEQIRHDAIRILKSGIFTSDGALKGARLSGHYRLYQVENIGELALMVAMSIKKVKQLDLIDDIFEFPDTDYHTEESEELFSYLKRSKLANPQRIARIQKENIQLIRAIKKAGKNIDNEDKPVEGGEVLLLFANVLNSLDAYSMWFPDKFASLNDKIKKIMTKIVRLRHDVFNQFRQLNDEPFYPGIYLIPHEFKRQIPSAVDNIIAKRVIDLLTSLGIDHGLTNESIRYELRKHSLRVTLHAMEQS